MRRCARLGCAASYPLARARDRTPPPSPGIVADVEKHTLVGPHLCLSPPRRPPWARAWAELISRFVELRRNPSRDRPLPQPRNVSAAPIALDSQLPPHPTSHCRTCSHSRAQYPKWVWSPAGGWWCNPPNWKRNTAICGAVWGVCLFFTARFSMENERRPLAARGHGLARRDEGVSARCGKRYLTSATHVDSQHIPWLYFLTDSFASRWDAR